MSAVVPADPSSKELALEAACVADSGVEDEPKLRVHLKTYVAIFAVCLVYVAQNFAIVGAGAVSQPPITN